jgi:GNAT superfamily N-acetyltransferase
MSVAAPVAITEAHRLEAFDCGVPSLNDWLRRRARSNHGAGASRTYVIAQDETVLGYYAIAASGVAIGQATGRFGRNMPDPIPVAVLGRLAVDTSLHGKGFGRALFRDAARRVLQAADILGIRGILVHALSDDARAFYIAIGFEPSPLNEMTLMVTMQDIAVLLDL